MIQLLDDQTLFKVVPSVAVPPRTVGVIEWWKLDFQGGRRILLGPESSVGTLFEELSHFRDIRRFEAAVTNPHSLKFRDELVAICESGQLSEAQTRAVLGDVTEAVWAIQRNGGALWGQPKNFLSEHDWLLVRNGVENLNTAFMSRLFDSLE